MSFITATKRLKANANLKQDEISILHKRWLQEYKWMQNLRTNFIVGAIQINDCEFLNYLAGRQNDMDASLPVIIMEYCNGGDLRSHLNKMINFNGLVEYEVRNILFALLRATEYLHTSCNIEHRDIKPENIVLHIKGNEKIYKVITICLYFYLGYEERRADMYVASCPCHMINMLVVYHQLELLEFHFNRSITFADSE